jgi:hypothetical protein
MPHDTPAARNPLGAVTAPSIVSICQSDVVEASGMGRQPLDSIFSIGFEIVEHGKLPTTT